MTDPTLAPSDRSAVVGAFDQARDAFLTAFAEVPDAALTYLPEGDEFTVGALLLHIAQPMRSYTRLLEEMAASEGRVNQDQDPGFQADQMQQRAEIVAARPAAADRAALLAALEAAHQHLRARLLATPDADFDRPVDVIYSGTTDPYPTSPRMVAGWVLDHYDEHTPQVVAMQAGWRESHPE